MGKCPGFRVCEYRLPGDRGPWTPALVRVDAPDPRAALESVVGPVAGFRLIGTHSEPAQDTVAWLDIPFEMPAANAPPVEPCPPHLVESVPAIDEAAISDRPTSAPAVGEHDDTEHDAVVVTSHPVALTDVEPPAYVTLPPKIEEQAPASARHAIGRSAIVHEDSVPLPTAMTDADKEFARRSGLITGPFPSFTAEDWRVWFEERAAILEHEAGQSRSDAERSVREHCVVAWSYLHPPASDRGKCAGCGKALDTAGHDWTPLGDATFVHYGGSYGLKCWQRHGEKQRTQAMDALMAMGIAMPAREASERAAAS